MTQFVFIFACSNAFQTYKLLNISMLLLNPNCLSFNALSENDFIKNGIDDERVAKFHSMQNALWIGGVFLINKTNSHLLSLPTATINEHARSTQHKALDHKICVCTASRLDRNQPTHTQTTTTANKTRARAQRVPLMRRPSSINKHETSLHTYINT